MAYRIVSYRVVSFEDIYRNNNSRNMFCFDKKVEWPDFLRNRNREEGSTLRFSAVVCIRNNQVNLTITVSSSYYSVSRLLVIASKVEYSKEHSAMKEHSATVIRCNSEQKNRNVLESVSRLWGIDVNFCSLLSLSCDTCIHLIDRIWILNFSKNRHTHRHTDWLTDSRLTFCLCTVSSDYCTILSEWNGMEWTVQDP